MRSRTMAVRLRRIAACRVDLLANGIDLSRHTPAELAAFVREHLEYFQLMLGDDSTHGQVLSLIRLDLVKVAVVPAAPPPGTAVDWAANTDGGRLANRPAETPNRRARASYTRGGTFRP